MKKKRQKTPKAKGITRIDDPGRHGVGWYARVVFRGKTSSKYFADGAHGGTRGAFLKALTWRNETEKKVGKPRTDRTFAAPGERSSTGILGVYQQKRSYVVAWTPTPGVLRREFISIDRYGREGALQRAIALRRKRERELYGRAVSDASALRRRVRATAQTKRPRPRRRAKLQKRPHRRLSQATRKRSRTRRR